MASSIDLFRFPTAHEIRFKLAVDFGVMIYRFLPETARASEVIPRRYLYRNDV
jgi:hypothetical protein